LPPVVLGKLEATSKTRLSRNEKEKIPSEDPSILSGEIIWQAEIFHTVFPVGDKFRGFAAGEKVLGCRESPPGSPQDEFAVGVIEIALSA
jgi:hypothetical protein